MSPSRLAALIRYRYPYTTATMVIAAAAIAALWSASWRKLGIVVLATLAGSFLLRLIGEIGYRRSMRRDERRSRP
jgi:uncharacterized membrane protein YjjP (DUF1212 family)